jgi:hypothetical protein
VSEPGYVANIIIFDVAARPVRNLIQNGILGPKGYWNWMDWMIKAINSRSGSISSSRKFSICRAKEKDSKIL